MASRIRNYLLISAAAAFFGCEYDDTPAGVEGLYQVRNHHVQATEFAGDAAIERGTMEVTVAGSPHRMSYVISVEEVRGEGDIEFSITDETEGITAVGSLAEEATEADLGLEGGDQLDLEFGADEQSVTMDGVYYADTEVAAEALVVAEETEDINAEIYATMAEMIESSVLLEDTGRGTAAPAFGWIVYFIWRACRARSGRSYSSGNADENLRRVLGAAIPA